MRIYVIRLSLTIFRCSTTSRYVNVYITKCVVIAITYIIYEIIITGSAKSLCHTRERGYRNSTVCRSWQGFTGSKTWVKFVVFFFLQVHCRYKKKAQIIINIFQSTNWWNQRITWRWMVSLSTNHLWKNQYQLKITTFTFIILLQLEAAVRDYLERYFSSVYKILCVKDHCCVIFILRNKIIKYLQ